MGIANGKKDEYYESTSDQSFATKLFTFERFSWGFYGRWRNWEKKHILSLFFLLLSLVRFREKLPARNATALCQPAGWAVYLAKNFKRIVLIHLHTERHVILIPNSWSRNGNEGKATWKWKWKLQTLNRIINSLNKIMFFHHFFCFYFSFRCVWVWVLCTVCMLACGVCLPCSTRCSRHWQRVLPPLFWAK